MKQILINIKYSDNMEIIKDVSELEKIKDNTIIGIPQLNNSTIQFKGRNNILFCENNVELSNSIISFEGNNSLIYLSTNNYPITLFVQNNSTVFIGKNNKIISKIIINIQENQNFIMGDDGLIGSGVNIRSSDGFAIYNCKTKKRINFTESIYIGDHVWLDYSSYISGGVQIGSGAIIGNHSYVPPYSKIPSNTYSLGNPAKVIKKDIFFTKEYVGNYNPSETKHTTYYKSNVFEFEYTDKETLSIDKIDEILKDLTIEDRLNFIIKLFVRNKRKNRFFINKN